MLIKFTSNKIKVVYLFAFEFQVLATDGKE